MMPPLEVRIRILKEVKFELLKRAIHGANVTDELEKVDKKLKQYGRLSRANRKKRKKCK